MRHSQFIMGEHRTSGVLGTVEIDRFCTSLPENIIPIQKHAPPYTPVDNGYFGFMGVTLLDQTLDRVQCHICGRWFKCLSAHLRIHDIDHITYKDRFGLYRSEPLARLKTRLKWSEMNKAKNQVKNLEGKVIPLSEETRKISYKARSKDQWKNKYGTCRAQLKMRLDNAIKKYGRLPTRKEEPRLHALFSKRFGNWTKGLEFYQKI